MKDLLLTALFLVHAVAFVRLYVRRGRRGFDLLFVGGYLPLAVFHAGGGLLSLAEAGSQPSCFSSIRPAGLVLCGLATPPSLIHRYRRRRGSPTRP